MVRGRIKNGLVATLGYLLSPFSWWNDLFINIPLAYGIAFLAGLISKNLFYPTIILAYWLTNVLGLVLMHHGVRGLISDGKKKYGRKELIKDFIFSILYTLIIVLLVKIGWLKFPAGFNN